MNRKASSSGNRLALICAGSYQLIDTRGKRAIYIKIEIEGAVSTCIAIALKIEWACYNDMYRAIDNWG